MNIEETKKAIEILQKYVEGNEIQCRNHGSNSWILANPDWNFRNCEYRVKPEPLECWVKMYGSTFASVFDNKNEALANGLNDGWTIRKFREVIE